jgi:predicted peptidase
MNSILGEAFQTGTWERELRRPLHLSYLLALPEGYERSNEVWPLLMFLHGAEERGNDLRKLVVNGIPKLLRDGATIPAIVVAPQCEKGTRWNPDDLLALLDHLAKKWRADRARVSLTGLSMGAYAVWELGLQHPDLFSAIAPVCGGAEWIDLALPFAAHEPKLKELERLKIWAFHGERDDVIPPSESQRLIEFLRNRLGNHQIRFTLYPGEGHQCWDKAYAEPDLIPWLIESGPTKGAGEA